MGACHFMWIVRYATRAWHGSSNSAVHISKRLTWPPRTGSCRMAASAQPQLPAARSTLFRAPAKASRGVACLVALKGHPYLNRSIESSCKPHDLLAVGCGGHHSWRANGPSQVRGHGVGELGSCLGGDVEAAAAGADRSSNRCRDEPAQENTTYSTHWTCGRILGEWVEGYSLLGCMLAIMWWIKMLLCGV
jgi:hypothetical protein